MGHWLAGGLVAALATTSVAPVDGHPRPSAAPMALALGGAESGAQAHNAAPFALLHLRLALSRSADQWLKTRRVRRLLAIELADVAEVDATPTGSLGDDLIRVWIDVPSSDRALIEVRHGHRSLARRILAISGYPGDAAARVVVIATANMVRVQARAARRRAEQPAPPPNHGWLPKPGGGVRWTGAASALVLPSASPGVLAGPELSLSHRTGWSSQRLYGRWLVGESDTERARWLEIGAAAGGSITLAPEWRLRLGGMAGAVALRLPEAQRIDGAPSTGADWTARLAATVGVERTIGRKATLLLDVEPGASLRSLELTDARGRQGDLGGFALGLRLGIAAGTSERRPTHDRHRVRHATAKRPATTL